MNILDRVKDAIGKSGYDAFLIFGHDHIRYLTGAMLPFRSTASTDKTAILWIKGKEPVLIVPAELKGTFRSMGKIRNVQAYYPEGAGGSDRINPYADRGTEPYCKVPTSVENLITSILSASFSKRASVGLTAERTPKHLFDAVTKALPEFQFSSCDNWFEGLRKVKTKAELALLREAAYKTDHAIAGAAHHVMVYAARPEKGLSEIIRVHCIERGLDATCYESLAVGASGVHAAEPWPEAPFYGVGGGKQLEKGELVRMEIRASLNGYWSDSARLLTMGPATSKQRAVYSQLNEIREELKRLVKPGISCKDIALRMGEFCEKKSLPLIFEHGLGHGIGVSPVEAPYLDTADETVIEEGMVLVFTPTVLGPAGELVRSYDTVIVKQDGVEVVGFYKDWSSPYKAVSSYQHGGG
ncbi:MAG: M24 family metallopeptidase [Spirochaetaceae bacterium]